MNPILAEDFVRYVAKLKLYGPEITAEECGGDMGNDAITCLNDLIEDARKLLERSL